jgi:hypothetical protein
MILLSQIMEKIFFSVHEASHCQKFVSSFLDVSLALTLIVNAFLKIQVFFLLDNYDRVSRD